MAANGSAVAITYLIQARLRGHVPLRALLQHACIRQKIKSHADDLSCRAFTL